MIKHYLDTMPALRPLIMVLKAFLTARSLNSAALGGLGSYALSLIAISFLQVGGMDRVKTPVTDFLS